MKQLQDKQLLAIRQFFSGRTMMVGLNLGPTLLITVLACLSVSATSVLDQQAGQPAEHPDDLQTLPEARANPLLQLQPFASSHGIVVPKRPTLIAGLNQQFKNRQGIAQPATGNSSTSASHGQPTSLSSPLGGLWAAGVQLVGLGSGNPRRSQSSDSLNKRQPSLNKRSAASPELASSLASTQFVNEAAVAQMGQPDGVGDGRDGRAGARSADEGQQQQQPKAYGSASSMVVGKQQATSNHYHNDNHNHLAPQQRSAVAPSSDSNLLASEPKQAYANHHPGQQQAQLYKGYSLIELEVRSETDRRFVQELYGNLSAALTELAQRPGSGGSGKPNGNGIGNNQSPITSVSPYADIDFWSFKCALNDHIDIMVSPKSRSFMVSQLNRAKIKHRIKIDDIQARLDAQQQQLAPLGQVVQLGELSGRHQQQHLAATSVGHHQAAVMSLDPLYAPGQQQPVYLNDSSFFEGYQRVADINQYLESLVARARDVAQVQVIGRSSQGRYLRVLRLGYEQRDIDGSTTNEDHSSNHLSDDPLANSSADSSSSSSSSPPIQANNASRIVDQFIKRQQAVRKLGSIWLDGGTHAREWISPATVLYISFRLADNHAKCLHFFDHLRMVANQLTAATTNRMARSSAVNHLGASVAQLDNDLLNGINEINTSLLGASLSSQTKPRVRSEFEQKLELLAKRPQELASEHSCDLELEQLLRRYTFYVMPVLNPDGYEYSHTHNRLWRKTRSTSNHPIYRHFCLGADPNRNYDARHGSTGSSGHPCSQTYGGATPFTEPETKHQSNFVYSHRAGMKMFISFHSYSQMILLPYSHSKQLAPDHKDLESVGQAGVKAIERTHGTQYRVGPSASILYTASGTASDWAYEKAGIKYSYTIELRDTGAFGFLLPRQQIIPTGEETFNGLLAMIGQMEKNDHLLTSKSISSTTISGKLLNETMVAGVDFVHAPDLDQLRPFGRFRPRPAQLENALDGSDTWATPQPPVPGVRDRRPPPASAATAAVGSPPVMDTYNANYHSDEGAYRIEDENVATSNDEPDAGFVFEGEGELMEPTGQFINGGSQRQQATTNGNQNSARRQSEQAHLYGLLHSSYQQQVSDLDNNHELDPDSVLQLKQMKPVGRQTRGNSVGPIDENRPLSVQLAPTASGQIRALPASMALSANGRTLINSPPQPSRTLGQVRRESSGDQISELASL